MNKPDERLHITWEAFHDHTKALSNRLKNKAEWTKLVCITRGGLAPASLVSRFLNFKHVETICLSSYHDETNQRTSLEIIKPFHSNESGILVIDDIVDSGKTFQKVRTMIPQAHMASLYAKPSGIPHVNTYENQIGQDTWVVFPWEI